MSIENAMYFALGFLAAALLAMMITPAIWRRAVRLTRRRIEAATPMTMAEFRADKDQLRAEFALSTRRLEKNIEVLRTRIGEQLAEVNAKKSELARLKSERDQQLTVVEELEGREGELRRRVLDLEKESTSLAQQLRQRERAYSDKVEEVTALRNGALKDEMQHELARMHEALNLERDRNAYLENQTRSLISRLEAAENSAVSASAAVATMRKAMSESDNRNSDTSSALAEAEMRIASAESRLNALLEETTHIVEAEHERSDTLLADKISLEQELQTLRTKVSDVESSILNDWESERVEQSHLRERLNDIAADVSRLVYEADGEAAPEESLFDKVRKYATDGLDFEDIGVDRTAQVTPSRKGTLADRMAALRDLQQS